MSGLFFDGDAVIVKPLGYDETHEKQVVISYDEYQKNLGNRFFAGSILTTSDGGVVNVGVKTPPLAGIEFGFSVYGSSRFEYRLFEDSTITSGTGLQVPVFNYNRAIARPSSSYIEILTTVVSAGVEMFAATRGLEGANPVAGSSPGAISHNIRMKKDSQYLFQVIGRDDDLHISGYIEWDENGV